MMHGTDRPGGRELIVARRSSSTGRPRLSRTLSLIVMVVAFVAPGPAMGAGGGTSVGLPAGGAAAAGDFSINLYQDGDFASQRTAYWCIGASMQMMLNIVGSSQDDSRTGQERYMRLARARGPSLNDVDHGQDVDAAGGLQGAGSSGWARGLVEMGLGGYREQPVAEYDAAVQQAALALRQTDRPVGLIVWRGAHSWVMSGFTATADPLADPSYRVTGVYIQDPWYPRVSAIWGPGQKPNTWISTKALKSDFLPRRGGRWHAETAGKYVLVVPFDVVIHPRYRRLL
jgi:hypothetical protein